MEGANGLLMPGGDPPALSAPAQPPLPGAPPPLPQRLVLLVEGSCAMGAFWPDARKYYIEQVLRYVGAPQPGQHQVRYQGHHALAWLHHLHGD